MVDPPTTVRTRYSTSTRRPDELSAIVPWLSSTGPLSYSPEQPPERDYWFQYGWVLPQVLKSGLARGRHYYFGAPYRQDAREAFAFWNAARAGKAEPLCVLDGKLGACAVLAPMAVYRWSSWRGEPGCLLIQHGSYQWASEEDQPRLEQGELYLYRGIQEARRLSWGGFESQMREGDWSRYFQVQAEVLSDSTTSFNSAHDRVKRCETSHLNDGTWMTDEVATRHGLDINRRAQPLWRASHESYSLAHWVAANKFGPHYAQFRTELQNVRLTTFFAGEAEVRVVDPRRVCLVEAVGCRVA